MKCPCHDDPCTTEACKGTPKDWIEGGCWEMWKDIIVNEGKEIYFKWTYFITKSGVECKCKEQPFVAVAVDGTVECMICHGIRKKTSGRAKMFSDSFKQLKKEKKVKS